ncbi:alpha/beta fold hydrolase [Cellulomonas carbonis]|uniref:Alpha/beta hydrolase n=1 Tax=Cellulomonas carbonis T26 TaxID=947969 RepID=A0A0A0BTE8_9CELL|nr:alpha/beta hydrolase [Cellulomonas carbonis]KGM11683.1 alpha/beta hydrolase [Cellulomonas carbonis T26]GGB99166.1 alpha/beta hydrolase [Cellulomonas carbonis]
MYTELDVRAADGRILHAYDFRPTDDADERLTVLWHHGTPNVGEPPVPLIPAARRLGVRWVSYDRPGYGGSGRLPGRDVASAARDAALVADALGVGGFAVMGHSGGGPHALACAALLPGRVTGAVSVSGLAPYDAEGLAWFEGMAPGGEAELRAATRGADELRRVLTEDEWDPSQFVAADHRALEGDWAWLSGVAGRASADGVPDGMVDDDLAYVGAWGFRPDAVTVPALLLHGDDDRVVPVGHARWLAGRLPAAELRVDPGAGHVSVLSRAEEALAWLVDVSRPAAR